VVDPLEPLACRTSFGHACAAPLRVHHRLIPRRGAGLLPVWFSVGTCSALLRSPALRAMRQRAFSRGEGLLPVCFPIAASKVSRRSPLGSIRKRASATRQVSLLTLPGFRPQRSFALFRSQLQASQTRASSFQSHRLPRSRGDVPRPRSSPPLPLANPLPYKNPLRDRPSEISSASFCSPSRSGGEVHSERLGLRAG
jgi:hypothetical protein